MTQGISGAQSCSILFKSRNVCPPPQSGFEDGVGQREPQATGAYVVAENASCKAALAEPQLNGVKVSQGAPTQPLMQERGQRQSFDTDLKRAIKQRRDYEKAKVKLEETRDVHKRMLAVSELSREAIRDELIEKLHRRNWGDAVLISLLLTLLVAGIPFVPYILWDEATGGEKGRLLKMALVDPERFRIKVEKATAEIEAAQATVDAAYGAMVARSMDAATPTPPSHS